MGIVLWAYDDSSGFPEEYIKYITNPHRNATCNRVLYCIDFATDLVQPANELLNRESYYRLGVL